MGVAVWAQCMEECVVSRVSMGGSCTHTYTPTHPRRLLMMMLGVVKQRLLYISAVFAVS